MVPQDSTDPSRATIRVRRGGPLVVTGDVSIVDSDGSMTRVTDSVVLCRCGASADKPFCDRAHRGVDFDS